MTRAIADIAASLVLIAALAWLMGGVLGSWVILVFVLAVWAIVRSLTLWLPAVRTAAGILFGDRYTTSDTLGELFSDVEDDVREELIPQVLEAAKRIHNWGSRGGAATVAILGLLFMWMATPPVQPFIFLFFSAAVILAVAFPVLKRRWDERPK